MKLAYFDCPSGASVDMVLGALVDAGCELGALEAALGSLGVDGWQLEARAVARGGLRGTHLVVRTDAGVTWHGLVMHTLAQGWCGLENLALIPGTVGAAPIQNIGAYGVEVREFVHAVEAFEPATGAVHRLDAAACATRQERALRAYRALGCECYARVDFIVPPDGEPVFLEANTLPGLTPRSLLPQAAAADGLDFRSLCLELVRLALCAKRTPL